LLGSTALVALTASSAAVAMPNIESFEGAMDYIMYEASMYPESDCRLEDEQTSTGQRYVVFESGPGLPEIRVEISGPDGKAVRQAAKMFCVPQATDTM
jgi:hypothetical protein